MAGLLHRADQRKQPNDYVGGLLGQVDRKNCWQLAVFAGQRSSDGMQHLLSRSVWDVQALRDAVRGYVAGLALEADRIKARSAGMMAPVRRIWRRGLLPSLWSR